MDCVQAVQPSTTPSLRSAKKQSHHIVTDIVYTAIQPSKTPSLRSPSKQVTQELNEEDYVNGSFKLELLDSPVHAAEAVKQTRTPSLRSPAQLTISKSHASKSTKRDSVPLYGLSRLMRTPKIKNTAVDSADNFEPELFKSPVIVLSPTEMSPPKSKASHCLGELTSPKELAQTGEGMSTKQPRRVTHQAPIEDTSTVESSSSQLKASPKYKVLAKVVKGGAKLANTRSSKRKAVEKEVTSLEEDGRKETPVIAKTNRKITSITEKEIEVTTQSKRTVPDDTPVTLPKPKRAKRDHAESADPRESDQFKTPQKRGRSASKAGVVAGVSETPKTLEFKRTELEPIPELPTPMKTPDVIEVKPQLKSTKKTRGSKRKTEASPADTSSPTRRTTRNKVTIRNTPTPRKASRATRSKKITAEIVESKETVSEDDTVEPISKCQISNKRKVHESQIKETSPPRKSRRVTSKQSSVSQVEEENSVPRKTRGTVSKHPVPSPVKEPEQVTRKGRRAAVKQPEPSPVKESEPVTRKGRRAAVKQSNTSKEVLSSCKTRSKAQIKTPRRSTRKV